MKIIINGASDPSAVDGIERMPSGHEVVYIDNAENLPDVLPGTEVLVGWHFRDKSLEEHWQYATELKWIHCCSAGVDAVLFPELRDSDVVVTNSRGIFDQPMAEYVLGYMLSQNKHFQQTWQSQQEQTWNYQPTTRLAGQRVVIYGVGSIGRKFARVLSSMGMQVQGVGRSKRESDVDFTSIHSIEDKFTLAGDADWIIGVLPQTEDTLDYFDKSFFDSLSKHCRFINVGRGSAVDEDALRQALIKKQIAGALLDVFKTEPLPKDNALWDTPNLMISPHMSGDYVGDDRDLFGLFVDNFIRYEKGEALQNVVDKIAGFVPSLTK